MHDLVDVAERLHERAPFLLPHALDLVEHGGEVAPGMQAAEIGDGEAVRLVADALQRLQGVVAAVDAHGVGGGKRVHFLLLLGERNEVDVRNAQLVENFLYGGELSPAAVDDDELRAGKALLFCRSQLCQAAAQHLLQGGEVVGALHGADAEAAVEHLVRLAVREHHHAAHLVHARNVGNIVALHALGVAGEVQQLL